MCKAVGDIPQRLAAGITAKGGKYLMHLTDSFFCSHYCFCHNTFFLLLFIFHLQGTMHVVLIKFESQFVREQNGKKSKGVNTCKTLCIVAMINKQFLRQLTK